MGFGPSSKTWPWWPPPRLQWSSVRGIISERSSVVPMAFEMYKAGRDAKKGADPLVQATTIGEEPAAHPVLLYICCCKISDKAVTVVSRDQQWRIGIFRCTRERPYQLYILRHGHHVVVVEIILAVRVLPVDKKYAVFQLYAVARQAA